MVGTVSDLTRATSARTGLRATFIEQRARIIQSAGLLPVATGKQHVAAKPRHLVHLLFSIAAARVRTAPHIVGQISELERIQTGERASDAVEQWIGFVWQGDSASRRQALTIVEHPRLEVILAANHYYPVGEIMDIRGPLDMRRSIDVPGKVIAAIGADLGFKGCANAA